MRGRAALLVPWLLAPLAACTQRTGNAAYVTTAAEPLHLTVTTDPPPRDDGTVARNARIRVELDDYPDPDGVYYGALMLLSGGVSFDMSLDVDLVGRAVVLTPRSPLQPGAQYEVFVAAGLPALDGRTLPEDVALPIRAGLDLAPEPAPAPAPTWNADIAPVLGTCAPFCHSPVGASGRMRTPTRSLDLTGDPTDPVFGLVGVPAVGEAGTARPLLRVSPGDPARSALLRKLIGGSPQADARDPPYPDLAVDGRRMPIPLDETAAATETLSDETLRRIQSWIAAGAPID